MTKGVESNDLSCRDLPPPSIAAELTQLTQLTQLTDRFRIARVSGHVRRTGRSSDCTTILTKSLSPSGHNKSSNYFAPDQNPSLGAF